MSMYNFAQHVFIELPFWMSWAIVRVPGWNDISPGSCSFPDCLGIQEPSSTKLWVILNKSLFCFVFKLTPCFSAEPFLFGVSVIILDSGQHVHRRAVGRAFQEEGITWARCKEAGKHVAYLGSTGELSLTGEDSVGEKKDLWLSK